LRKRNSFSAFRVDTDGILGVHFPGALFDFDLTGLF
jgi:hypothetical protein